MYLHDKTKDNIEEVPEPEVKVESDVENNADDFRNDDDDDDDDEDKVFLSSLIKVESAIPVTQPGEQSNPLENDSDEPDVKIVRTRRSKKSTKKSPSKSEKLLCDICNKSIFFFTC